MGLFSKLFFSYTIVEGIPPYVTSTKQWYELGWSRKRLTLQWIKRKQIVKIDDWNEGKEEHPLGKFIRHLKFPKIQSF